MAHEMECINTMHRNQALRHELELQAKLDAGHQRAPFDWSLIGGIFMFLLAVGFPIAVYAWIAAEFGMVAMLLAVIIHILLNRGN